MQKHWIQDVLPPPCVLLYFCSELCLKGFYYCLLQVHPVPPSPEHPGTGREPDREVQLQLRGGSYSCTVKLNAGVLLDNEINQLLTMNSFCYLFTADEQTEHRKPAGDSGLSGHTEERSDQCCEAGLSLPLGAECDAFSSGNASTSTFTSLTLRGEYCNSITSMKAGVIFKICLLKTV